MWSRGGEPDGNKWPECCGFVNVSESQYKWLIMHHGSFDVVPASIGPKTTDQTWHYEQWMHLKIRQSQTRRHASPWDSKSRRHRRRVRVAATCWVTSVTPTVSGVALQLPASFLCRYHSLQIRFSCLPHCPLCGSVATPRAVPVPQLSSTPLGVVSLPLRHARLPSFGCCPRPWRGCPAAAPCAAPFDQLRFPRRQPGPRRNQARLLGPQSQIVSKYEQSGACSQHQPRGGGQDVLSAHVEKTCADFVERCTLCVP